MVSVPQDKAMLSDGVLNELYKRHPYLAQYPAEVEVVHNDESSTFGEIHIASQTGSAVSIPFVVKDGKLRPFVAVGVDGKVRALGGEDEFQEVLESPVPIQPGPPETVAPQVDPRMQMILGGPDYSGGGGYRNNLAYSLSKQGDLLESLARTPLAERLAKIVEDAGRPDVIQYERVPFGVLVKKASASDFDPEERFVSLDDMDLLDRESLLEAFDGRDLLTEVVNPPVHGTAVTRAVRLSKEASTIDSVSVSDVYDAYNHKRVKREREQRSDKLPVCIRAMDTEGNVRVFSIFRALIDEEPKRKDDGSVKCGGDFKAFAVADDGAYTFLTPWQQVSGETCKDSPMEGSPISDIFKVNKGNRGYVVSTLRLGPGKTGDGDKAVVGPLEFIREGKILFDGFLVTLKVSKAVKVPGVKGDILYLPEDAKFLPATKAVELKPPSELDTLGGLPVVIEKKADGFTLSGEAVSGARMGDWSLPGVRLSAANTLLALGALGVDERWAVQKMAEAEERRMPVEIEVYSRLRTIDHQQVSVDLGMLKLAAEIPGEEDRFMALQMLGDQTMDKILDNLSAVRDFADDLAVVTLHAQLGYSSLDEGNAYQALQNVMELYRQLRRAESERSLAQASGESLATPQPMVGA
jgi:hypothetical protein